MFFFILNHQGPFPSCTSQSTLPPLNALQYWARLWTCCVDSSDSNLVLLLRVLASKYLQLSERACFLPWAALNFVDSLDTEPA